MMGELMKLAAAASMQLGIQPELLSGMPTVELSGNAAAAVEQHGGIRAYSEQEIGINTSLGTLWLRGDGLTIRLMNRERIIVYGRIDTVCFGEQGT